MRPPTVAGLLLGAYAALVLALASTLHRTADETAYLAAGQAIVRGGWEHETTRLHGPLPFLANQLFAFELPQGWHERGGLEHAAIVRGRWGMLPFGLLAGWLTYAWSRRLWGPGGGLLALALFVSNPLTLGYGGLIAVDMAYTAGTLLALFLAARFVERPTPGRGAAVGLGLGAACATKYLAVFAVPVVLAAVAVGAARGGSRRRAPLGAPIGVALLALLSLYACYGFRVGPAEGDPAAYASPTMARVVGTPVVGDVVALLPRPYLEGADFQLAVGGDEHRTYLEGRIAAGHPDYYAWVFLRKTPEWLLLLGVLALLGLVPRSLRGAERRPRRIAVALLAPTAAILLAYLSLCTSLQIGVRYVLPLYPFAFVLCGSAVPWVRGLGAGAPRTAARVAAAGLVMLAVRDLASVWPNLIAYYNPSSGGLAEGWRHFDDSNTDWGQCLIPGRRQLEQEPDVALLSRGAGPRFGRCAVELLDLCRPDPEDPGRARHWVHALAPYRHLGGAWWLYEVTPEAWEAAVARSGDERSRADLAVAYLGATHEEPGFLAAAEVHVESLGEARARPLRELAGALRRLGELSTPAAFALVQRWTDLGRFDRAEAVLREHPALAGHPARTELLVHALARQFRVEEALAVAEARDPSGSLDAILLLGDLHRRAHGLAASLDAIDRWLPTLAGPDADRAREARAALEVLRSREERFRRLVAAERPAEPPAEPPAER